MDLLDLADALNLIVRLEGFASRFLHADWNGATKKAGVGGLISEMGRSLIGDNAWTFTVSRECDLCGADIERFLRKYGIVIWERRVTSDHMIFSVKARQANWAEYLLLRRGLPVVSRPYNVGNRDYAQSYAPGDVPPAWADRPASRNRRSR